MSKWQPIETAPKSGRQVLVYTTWKMTPDYPCPDFDAIQIGWWSADEEWILEKVGTPTHWMPLPSPPENAR